MMRFLLLVALVVAFPGDSRARDRRAPSEEKSAESFIEAKLAEIVAAPAKFHGKLVMVTGYRRNSAVTDDIFISKAEAVASVRSASIQLAGFKDPEKAVFSLAEHDAISNTEVQVLGVFYVDDFFPEQKGYLTQLRWIRPVKR